MELWEYPDSYIGKTYYDYYVLISRHRNSGLIDNCNFDVALKMLDYNEDDDNEDVIIACASHFLVGWIDTIMIHKDAIDKIKIGEEIENKLYGYPFLDEDKYYEIENDRQYEIYSEILTDILNGNWQWHFDKNPVTFKGYFNCYNIKRMKFKIKHRKHPIERHHLFIKNLEMSIKDEIDEIVEKYIESEM